MLQYTQISEFDIREDHMAYPVVSRCPICSDTMLVTRLHCRQCDSSLEGRFELSRFTRLTTEQLSFAELFIRCEGKLSHVGDELNLSYPTVRNRLNDMIRALGYEVAEDSPEVHAERRLDILSELSEGQITPEEAIKRLKKA